MRNHPELTTPMWRTLLAIIIGGLVLAIPISQVSFLGHDWLTYFAIPPNPYFEQESTARMYPPWALDFVLRPVAALPPHTGLAVMSGLTISAVTILAYTFARRTFPHTYQPAVLAVIMALVSPLPWMMCWLGQVDVLTLLGLVSMPFGIPLLLSKIHIGIWAALGSRRDMLWAGVFLAVSLILWGFWPRTIMDSAGIRVMVNPELTHVNLMGWPSTHPIIGVIGLMLLLLTNRHPIRLIAAGMLVSPYLMPYMMIVLVPALGMVRGYRQILLWLVMLPLIFTVGVSTLEFKLIGLLFPVMTWALTAPSLKPADLINDPDILINRARAEARALLEWSRLTLKRQNKVLVERGHAD